MQMFQFQILCINLDDPEECGINLVRSSEAGGFKFLSGSHFGYLVKLLLVPHAADGS